MFPDFPEEKMVVSRELNEAIRAGIRSRLGPFAHSPRFTHHEGDSWRLHREDGTTDDSSYTEVSAEFSWDRSRMVDMTQEELRQLLNQVAEDLAQKEFKHHIGIITQAVSESGQRIDTQGQPFSKELFLAALERFFMSFNDDGTPVMPTILVHPDQGGAIVQKLTEWNEDPEFKAQYGALISRKREEWRAREASRKLVDQNE